MVNFNAGREEPRRREVLTIAASMDFAIGNWMPPNYAAAHTLRTLGHDREISAM